jgi:hypothetical protein
MLEVIDLLTLMRLNFEATFGIYETPSSDDCERRAWLLLALNELYFWTLSIVWCLKN